MTLTWKDLITTLLAGGAIGVYFLFTNNAGGYRIPILLLTFIGIAMCALSEGTKGNKVYIGIASALGILALVLAVYGLVTGAKIAFILLVGTILLLWLISTIRHALGIYK
jgi:hypothetical protein